MTITIIAGVNNVTTDMLLEGDANGDNQVNIADFSILAAAFNTSEGDSGYDARADFNDDNAVNIADFSLMASNFGLVGDGGVIAP
jgi:large repetitive protein